MENLFDIQNDTQNIFYDLANDVLSLELVEILFKPVKNYTNSFIGYENNENILLDAFKTFLFRALEYYSSKKPNIGFRFL